MGKFSPSAIVLEFTAPDECRRALLIESTEGKSVYGEAPPNRNLNIVLLGLGDNVEMPDTSRSPTTFYSKGIRARPIGGLDLQLSANLSRDEIDSTKRVIILAALEGVSLDKDGMNDLLDLILDAYKSGIEDRDIMKVFGEVGDNNGTELIEAFRESLTQG